jgi:hypothetical protein
MMSTPLFYYMFHLIVVYLTFIFEPAHLVNAEGHCRRVRP